MLKPNMCLRIFLSLLLLKTVLAEEKKPAVSDKLLEYAETRANNAESELAKFKQQHEDSMAACAEIKAVKTKEVELCKDQSEEFRKLYNQCQEKKSITERDLLEAKEAVKIEMNKCHMKEKASATPSSMNTLERIQDVVSDIFVLYKSSFQMILNYIPPHVKTQVTDKMHQVYSQSDSLWQKYARKEYAVVGKTIDSVHENWNVYVYPNMMQMWDKSVIYGAALWENVEVSVNDAYIDPFLMSMDRTVYSKLPTSLLGRLAILVLLIAVAYYTAKICIFHILCSVLCCRRRKRSSSKKKKTFTAADMPEKSLTPQKMDGKKSQMSRSDYHDDDGVRRRK